MPLRILDASRAINPTVPKEIWRNAFQERIYDQFYNSSDWWTIQEETYFSSGVFKDIDVRITGVISNETGSTPTDDFKKLLFRDIDHLTALGWFYWFDDNFWIVVNTERTKTLNASCTVKRCNNVLRWIDELGGKYSVPFTLADYLIRENRNYSTSGSALVNPSGIIEIATQFNDKTNKIKANQRFLFGNPTNWTSYRVQGGGVNNLNLLKTEDNMSAGLIKFSLAVDYSNLQDDDLVNGYANLLQNIYSILVLNGNTITGLVGNTNQINTQVLRNSIVVSRDLIYTSSDTSIVTVSDTGLISFVSAGSTIIRVQLLNNIDVYTDITIVSSAVPVNDYDILISPNVNYVLLNQTTSFITSLILNNVVVPTTFTFTLTPNTVPSANYTYSVVDGDTFSIQNKIMFLTDSLDVLADDGAGHTKTFSILLRGGW
jgi:hypothetical protein